MPALETSYLYAPGLFGSPIVIGRYCSRYPAHTGEIIYGTRGGDIFGEGFNITAVVFPEILTAKPKDWFRRTITPSFARSVFMSKFGIVVRENPAGTDTVFNYIFDPRKANIGQTGDITAVKNAFDLHCTRHPNTQIVLFGDSRGAASILSFLAQDKPSIACCICEGIFDSMPHLLKHCFGWGWKGDLIEQLLQNTILFCSKTYTVKGPFPIDYIDEVPRTIPILLVASVVDRIVPLECTVKMYCELYSRGYEYVHLLILPNSQHDSYMVGPDKEMYETCVHAFYKAYGIHGYEPQKAAKGAQFLAGTRPSIETLRAQYKLHKPCCALSQHNAVNP